LPHTIGPNFTREGAQKNFEKGYWKRVQKKGDRKYPEEGKKREKKASNRKKGGKTEGPKESKEEYQGRLGEKGNSKKKVSEPKIIRTQFNKVEIG